MIKINLSDFPGYMAGDDGSIYSDKGLKTRKLKSFLDTKGRYYIVILRTNGKNKTCLVHRLICSTFNGKPLKKQVASHIDGNCNNNIPKNLLWETQKENLLRRYEHGTDDAGVNNSRAKFNLKQIKKIRVMLSEGVKSVEIARKMNCDDRLIGKIKRGERYKKKY